MAGLLWSSPFQVQLKEGPERLICVRTYQRDTLIISPDCATKQYYAIPQEQLETVCNDDFCIDLSAPLFDPKAHRSPLEIAMADTVNFPDVSIWLQNDQNQIARFLGYEKDSLLIGGVLPNGEHQMVRLHKNRLKGVEFANGKWLNLNLKSFQFPKDSGLLIEPLAAMTVHSKPSGAKVFLDGVEMGVSPIQLNRTNAGPRNLHLQTQILGQNYSGLREVRLYPGEKKEVYLTLKRETPELIIKSNPKGADVYLDPIPNLAEPSIFKTPYHSKEIRSGLHNLTLFHPSAKDTTLIIEVAPFKPTIIDIELYKWPIKGIPQSHQSLLDSRQNQAIFKGLQYSSIPLILAGALFHYNSHLSREDAYLSRNKLQRPHVAGGQTFNNLRKENSEQFQRAQILEYTAWGLLGAGVLLQGIAWTFYF